MAAVYLVSLPYVFATGAVLTDVGPLFVKLRVSTQTPVCCERPCLGRRTCGSKMAAWVSLIFITGRAARAGGRGRAGVVACAELH